METSQALATESFSLRWLSYNGPSFEEFRTSDEGERKSFLEETSSNFSFRIPISSCSTADEIFSDGLIVPVHSSSTALDSSPLSPKASTGMSTCLPEAKFIRSYSFLVRWRRSLKETVWKKLLRFLRPRKSIRVDDIDVRVSRGVDRWSSSNSTHQQRPILFHSYSADVSYEFDSISDAVLHCKRSFEI